ncbi:unnamed protein product [Caretta caretta]
MVSPHRLFPVQSGGWRGPGGLPLAPGWPGAWAEQEAAEYTCLSLSPPQSPRSPQEAAPAPRPPGVADCCSVPSLHRWVSRPACLALPPRARSLPGQAVLIQSGVNQG